MTSIAFVEDTVRKMSVHVLPANKFKTNTIVMQIQQDLREHTVTKTALLSLVLKRATEKYPTSQELREHLDRLYGAVFDTDVIKKGERQILQLSLEIANERYLTDPAPLLAEGIQFLGEVIARPLTEGNRFFSKYVDTEKETLKRKLESLVDDKIRYAAQRVAESMCHDEPYRFHPYGRKEDIDGITPEDLFEYYLHLVRTHPIDVYVVGDVDPDQVKTEIDRRIPLERHSIVTLNRPVILHPVSRVNEVIERLQVTQGKLNIGCRTQLSYADDEYVHLLMYNGILGGFPHSKLFINVREKASLAYYASSRLESHKGLLMIMSGIEIPNYQKAIDIMKEQMKMMREGQISEQELNQTKATLSNQLREMMDHPRTMIDLHFNGVISGRHRTLEELLDEINRTGIDEIQRVSEKVDVDTIYFLRNHDQEGSSS